MKIIIAGAGEVGYFLAQMLTTQQKHEVIVIDRDKEILNELSAHFDILALHGSATSIEILKRADTANADLFIAVTSIQEINIIASMLAKKLGAKFTVARVDNDEYIELQHKNLFTELGIDAMIYPEILASEEIIHYLKHPSILKSIYFASGKLSMLTIKIKEGTPLENLTLEKIAQKYPNITARIVAIQRQDKTIIPRGKDKILKNDVIYIITDSKGSQEILQAIGIKDFEIKNVMILGGSRIGVKLAHRLQKCCYVKLFEKDRDKSIELAEILTDTLVIHSEARSEEFLLEEGISHTDAFIAVTGNSEINILSCMLAKKLGVKKTIAEVENTDYLDLAKKMDIDLIINKKLIAANYIYAYTINAEVLSIKYFSETEAKVLEFIVHENALITKKPLKDINFPEGAIIGGIEREKEVFIAVGNTQIKAGDRVVVFSMPEVIDKVAKFFR